MFPVLHARADVGCLYLAGACGVADIAALVGDAYPEVLASADRSFDFWFPSDVYRHPVNRAATEILHVQSGFAARTVPLLRGSVVVCTRDASGEPRGLRRTQLESLTVGAACARDHRALARRFVREEQRQQARVRAWRETWALEWLYGRDPAV